MKRGRESGHQRKKNVKKPPKGNAFAIVQYTSFRKVQNPLHRSGGEKGGKSKKNLRRETYSKKSPAAGRKKNAGQKKKKTPNPTGPGRHEATRLSTQGKRGRESAGRWAIVPREEDRRQS